MGEREFVLASEDPESLDMQRMHLACPCLVSPTTPRECRAANSVEEPMNVVNVGGADKNGQHAGTDVPGRRHMESSRSIRIYCFKTEEY